MAKRTASRPLRSLGSEHVWRAGYKITNFVHDELVVAVPKTENLAQEAEQIAVLMRAGMHEVVPDVHIEVDAQIVDRWSKDASVELDNGGYLAVDSPTKVPAQVGTSAQGQVVTPVTMSPLRVAASVV